jgi:hypothetical protein
MEMVKKVTKTEQSRRSLFSTILLLIVLTILFIVPVFPIGSHKFIFNILLTLLLFFAAMTMERHRKNMLFIAILALVFEWIAYFLDLSLLLTLSQTVLFVYFILVVVGLIIQVATTAKVTARVIVESISGYLLMGIVFSLIIMVLARNVSSAYSFSGVVREAGVQGWQMSEFIYYGFITYTTLGYGDIGPLLPVSRAVAVLASVTGQIYLTVIIAMLVGKFLSGRQED